MAIEQPLEWTRTETDNLLESDEILRRLFYSTNLRWVSEDLTPEELAGTYVNVVIFPHSENEGKRKNSKKDSLAATVHLQDNENRRSGGSKLMSTSADIAHVQRSIEQYDQLAQAMALGALAAYGALEQVESEI